MSKLVLDIQEAHSEDLSEPFEGKFGNIYHTWDQNAARRREVDDRQQRIELNRLSATEVSNG